VVAIGASLLAKGQNVAQLVGLAFAVAASANLPALLGTLYWKRCNTFGVTCSVVGGTVAAIVLVLVSPNMQYPLTIRADATLMLVSASATMKTAGERMNDPVLTAEARKSAAAELAKADALRQSAQATLTATGQATTSVIGLEKPLVNLRNPGIISIPLGVIFLVLGSLFYRKSACADEKWKELIFRRDSGIGIDEAVKH